MNRILLLFFFYLTISSLYCKNIDSLKTENEFIILPFGFYTNETSVALGVFSQYHADQDYNIFGNVFYTFNHQFMFFSITDKIRKDLIFHNVFKIKDYYSNFYGVGNETISEDREEYRYFLADNYIEAGRKVFTKMNISLVVNNFYFKPKDEPAYYQYYTKKKEHITTGLGLSLSYSDVTESYFRDGINYKSALLFYPDVLGNIGEFSIIDSEVGLFSSFRESSFNFLLSSRFGFGHVHPEKLSFIGGTKIMRGYPEKRYTDYNMLSAQLQYDIRVYKDLAACFFVSTGDVFHDFSDMSIAKTKLSYGAGLNYLYKKIVMRIEAAASLENDFEIIITGNRAF